MGQTPQKGLSPALESKPACRSGLYAETRGEPREEGTLARGKLEQGAEGACAPAGRQGTTCSGGLGYGQEWRERREEAAWGAGHGGPL